jgi:hypothetical protein
MFTYTRLNCVAIGGALVGFAGILAENTPVKIVGAILFVPAVAGSVIREWRLNP